MCFLFSSGEIVASYEGDTYYFRRIKSIEGNKYTYDSFADDGEFYLNQKMTVNPDKPKTRYRRKKCYNWIFFEKDFIKFIISYFINLRLEI